jgi:hypothetical protein
VADGWAERFSLPSFFVNVFLDRPAHPEAWNAVNSKVHLPVTPGRKFIARKIYLFHPKIRCNYITFESSVLLIMTIS